jgi:hypothetical protein
VPPSLLLRRGNKQRQMSDDGQIVVAGDYEVRPNRLPDARRGPGAVDGSQALAALIARSALRRDTLMPLRPANFVTGLKTMRVVFTPANRVNVLPVLTRTPPNLDLPARGPRLSRNRPGHRGMIALCSAEWCSASCGLAHPGPTDREKTGGTVRSGRQDGDL